MLLALALVAGAAQKLSLLMLAHLLAPLFDHIAHRLPRAFGGISRKRMHEYSLLASKLTPSLI